MTLKNTIVIFTVILPELEVDPNLGIALARAAIRIAARTEIKLGADETTIKDCPDYPALCD